MVSRSEQHKKRVNLHEKLQLLRSVTNSESVNISSILVDTTRYIQELKQKVEKLNEDIAYITRMTEENEHPIVTVKTSEKGFAINVFSVNSCPGMLVSILEAFDDLGLDVHEARANCAGTFCLEAVGGENLVESVDAPVVKQAVLQALNNFREIN